METTPIPLSERQQAIVEEGLRRAAYPLRTLSWEGYDKHLACMRAGKDHRERLMLPQTASARRRWPPTRLRCT